jgi:predicted acylesterase/phospholipase RssA
MLLFRSLALGGGGTRGGLHVGALQAIEEIQGTLKFPEGIYGCSVGSIMATAVAFGLSSSQIKEMFTTYFDLEKILPPLRLSSVTGFTQTKGLFTMDILEETVIKAFESQKIDIREKRIEDTPQKLYIVASNITTKRPTFLTGKVPVLEAIKCSSCLPLVFAPRILYNQVYLDGGLYVDSMASVVPKDCLVVHISEESEHIYPNTIQTIPISNFVHTLYRSIRNQKLTENTCWLHNNTVGILQPLTHEDKTNMIREGYLQTAAFLTKRLAQVL